MANNMGDGPITKGHGHRQSIVQRVREFSTIMQLKKVLGEFTPPASPRRDERVKPHTNAPALAVQSPTEERFQSESSVPPTSCPSTL